MNLSLVNSSLPLKVIQFLFLLTMIFLFLNFTTYGQTPYIPPVDINTFAQELFQQQDQNLNYEDFYESLYQFYTNPLDLNTATKEDLQSLYLLSEIQINSILDYRALTGELISVYELQAIPHFDLFTCGKLLPFVEIRNKFIEPHQLWSKIAREKNNYLLLRYSWEGNNPRQTNYAGNSDNLYCRFRSSHSKDYSLGFTFEKDAGEKIIWNPSTKRYFFDFWSCHFSLFNKGKFKAISLGDYQLQFGQGLILSSGFSIGKGSETVTTTRRSNIGIRSYTSVLESGYFRGGAFTYTLSKNFDFTGFYSDTKRDAVVHSDSIMEDSYITSIQNSGYHRTQDEIASKHRINQESFGGNISFQRNDLHIGISFVKDHYQVPLHRPATVYNQFAFEGNNNFNSSVDYSYTHHNFNFFGEGAISMNGGKGLITGFVASLSSQIEMAMVYRNYARNFQGMYGNAFGENTSNSNERGIYWGIKIRPFTQWTISAYYDKFSFPWLKYQVDAPSFGNEYLLRINYQPSKLILLYLQIRRENKEKNQRNDYRNMNWISPAIKNSYLINLDYKAKEFISMQSRLQISSYSQTNSISYGYFLMEEVEIDFQKVKFNFRYALFDTDDYDNRQYSYENDVLYSFSIPALYGKGSRLYAMARVKILKNTDFWLKYSKTSYFNPSITDKSEIKMEIRYIF